MGNEPSAVVGTADGTNGSSQSDGRGADVEIIEGDQEMTIQVETPNGKTVNTEVARPCVPNERYRGADGQCDDPGQGADVQFVEGEDGTSLSITLPTGDVIIREVKKKNISDPGGPGDGNLGAKVEFIEGSDGTVLSISLPNNGRIVREVGKKI